MSLLSENIRYLRSQLKQSQQKVADDLIITRGRYAKYEDGASEPPVELLIRISRYFHVSIDLLVSVDLRKISMQELINLPDNRILLPIAVDSYGENTIVVIPHKASMGYLNGYSDPEYIEGLQHISLPFLGIGNYRAFPAEGDSMPPHTDGSYIIGRYMERLSSLKTGKSYVFVTRTEGITFKRLTAIGPDFLTVCADNAFYAPYHIAPSDVFEIWEYACSIATKDYNPGAFNLEAHTVLQLFQEIKNEVLLLKERTT